MTQVLGGNLSPSAFFETNSPIRVRTITSLGCASRACWSASTTTAKSTGITGIKYFADVPPLTVRSNRFMPGTTTGFWCGCANVGGLKTCSPVQGAGVVRSLFPSKRISRASGASLTEPRISLRKIWWCDPPMVTVRFSALPRFSVTKLPVLLGVSSRAVWSLKKLRAMIPRLESARIAT